MGHEIYNFGRPLLSHHNYILRLSGLCSGVVKKIFSKLYTPKLSHLGVGGHEIYTFLSPYLTGGTYQDWPCSS